MFDDTCVLYHLCDPEHSSGFGFDGYIGITNDFNRRRREHMDALARGIHGNHRLQKLYWDAGGHLQMHLVRSGSREQMFAAEALLVPCNNLHANRQRGGGPLRGRPVDELLRLSRSQPVDMPRAVLARSPSAARELAVAAAVAVAVVIVIAGVVYYFQQRTARARVLRDNSALPACAMPPCPWFERRAQSNAGWGRRLSDGPALVSAGPVARWR